MTPTADTLAAVRAALAGLGVGVADLIAPDAAPVAPVLVVNMPQAIERTSSCTWVMSVDITVHGPATSSRDGLVDLTDRAVSALTAAHMPCTWLQDWQEHADRLVPVTIITVQLPA